ncbi:P-loop containing nucleoside triphosphate hydrolase protein [Pseudovirgaria hyperparasitica]|uniref:RNA helicase n=1 Tax=Pseudovirgaria hyperparasitica TaxID=470096 RepID=A0A6A6VV74_9PEZI|nr:P-loop containing nucleoside triphosphate hydrolase protein [Pseudovirgaria hyperparasitica]KAF2753167.1 P-loop containing nucleoside triphosphate hydrolase protein [Pseudovirgaria hyperparasitica]
MDVLKLLTRSTKYSKANSHQTSASKTPSSGQTNNPQLFASHAPKCDESEPPRKKRKAENGDGDLPQELNFFAEPLQAAAKGDGDGRNRQGGAGKSKKETKFSTDKIQETTDGVGTDKPVLGEEECKKILRTHKIKITVLENLQADLVTKKREKHSKKKKRSNAEEAPVKKKTEIYPQPLQDFEHLRTRYGVHGRIVRNIRQQAYTIPTEVQLGSLPLLLSSSTDLEDSVWETPNLLAVAPTGSGKTLAFLIPVVDSIAKLKASSNDETLADGDDVTPRAIVVAPTKELASQIVNEGRKLSQGTKVKFALMRKGMEVVERTEPATTSDDRTSDDDSDSSVVEPNETTGPAKTRKRGQLVKADILVSTPLALVNALTDTTGTTLPLRGARYLILDEADVLLDPLFREQTLSIWKSCTSPSLRVSLWSATMGSNVESLVVSTITSQRKAVELSMKQTSMGSSRPRRAPIVRLVIGLKDTAVPNITHKLVYCATEPGKLLAVRQLLRPTSSTDSALRPPFLIFTQTIPRALALHAELQYDIPPEAGGSARIAVLHSSLSETIRANTLARFRKGEVWVLVTTDLLARGVDFKGLNGVVNYDAPASAATYVHRVGRTGRAGRDGGIAVTLWAKEDVPHMKSITNVIAAAEKLRGKEGVPSEDLVGDIKSQQWLFDSLPTPSKNEKKSLKKRGVEARRPGAKLAKGVGKISTKVEARKRKKSQSKGAGGDDVDSDEFSS